MASPHPRPDGQRQARPGRDIPWTDIDQSPRTEKPPAVPKWAGLAGVARQWWAWAWKLPVARLWGEAEVPQVVRRAQLEERWQATRDEKILPEMRHLEAALLMTAKARKEARVRFVTPAAEPKAAPRSRSRAKLRVVDDQAS